MRSFADQLLAARDQCTALPTIYRKLTAPFVWSIAQNVLELCVEEDVISPLLLYSLPPRKHLNFEEFKPRIRLETLVEKDFHLLITVHFDPFQEILLQPGLLRLDLKQTIHFLKREEVLFPTGEAKLYLGALPEDRLYSEYTTDDFTDLTDRWLEITNFPTREHGN